MRIKMLIMCFVCLLVSCKQAPNPKSEEDFSALSDASCKTILLEQQKCENQWITFDGQSACSHKYNGHVIAKCGNQNINRY